MRHSSIILGFVLAASCGPAASDASSQVGPASVASSATSGSRTNADADTPTAREVSDRLTAQFGRPSSTAFAALSTPLREAVERYFVLGRGAVPEDGLVDPAATSIGHGPGSRPRPPLLIFGDPVPGYPGLFNLTIGNTGTGVAELFLLQLLDVPSSGPTPLLVVFHKYGVSHGDALFNTNFVHECRSRGWYMLAPLGANQHNYGSLVSQTNVEAVLDWLRAYLHLPIDPTRVYGVGFSMGGGGCASYAARHLDPNELRFAAIVNHTGSVSLVHAYANESAQAQSDLEGQFGGPPSTQLFDYQRCSTVDIDPVTETVGVGTDMARNLAVVHSWLASGDSTYLSTQTQVFQAFVHDQNPENILTIAPGNVHSWSTLDDTAACDWLAQYTLPEPSTANTLADRDGAWHHFRIDQDAAGVFTPFSWLVDASVNRLTIYATKNLHRISVDSPPLGLVYSGALKLNLTSADGTGDQVLFLHVPGPPVGVTRNSVPASALYDPQAHTLLVDETSGAGSHWVIQF